MAEKKSTTKKTTTKKTTTKKSTPKVETASKNPQVRFDGMVWEIQNKNSSGDILIRNEKGMACIVKATDTEPLNKAARDYIG